MKQHYRVQHNETAPKDLGDIVHAYLHSCAICKMKVLNDTFELATHLAVRHSMSVDGYAQEFLKKSTVEVEIITPKKLKDQRKNLVEDETAVVSPEHGTRSPEPPSLTDEFHRFSDINSEHAPTPATPDKLSGDREDNNTESDQTLATPGKLTGKLKEKDSEAKTVQEVKHQCNICMLAGILSFGDADNQHLNDAHGLTYKEYEEMYQNREERTEESGGKTNYPRDIDEKKKIKKIKPTAKTTTTSPTATESTTSEEDRGAIHQFVRIILNSDS
jgi:hypothetical protein